MDNPKVAQIFSNIAKILEIKGDNPFRIRAYERAAININGLTEGITKLIEEGRLSEINGIGKDLSRKITEIVETGALRFYEDLKKTIPAGLLELLDIPSLGAKKVKLFYEELGIKDIQDLEAAIAQDKLKGIFGIKDKTVENIKEGLQLLKRGKERMPLTIALQTADEFITALKKLVYTKKVSPAGSLRRQKETVRDIDILVASQKPAKIMEEFVHLPSVKRINAQGLTKSSVLTENDVQVDCRVVENKCFGAALLYFTGSKEFNIRLRQYAQRHKLKINEYGVFDERDKYLAGKSEEEIFKFLKMSFIDPELREDRGEIEAALKGQLPDLVTLSDIKGDLHIHSRWSDGTNTIEEIVRAAKILKYDYIAITDHSQSLKIARGLSIADLRKKRKEIEKINRKLKNFRVLFGSEVDIDSDGRLDYPEQVLKEFDIVIAAIHTGFKQSRERLTKRLISACQNPYVHIISHPTGRLWGSRAAYDVDLERVFKAARKNNIIFEINSHPYRLDLNDVNAMMAKQHGLCLCIGSDAHGNDGLKTACFGISVARRAWLSKKDILNTVPVEKLLKTIKK